MSSHTEFQANVNGTNTRTVGRVIGHKGSGTKRITNEVKRLFPGSRCYIRGDRETCNFLIKTFGANGEAAARHAGEMLTAEINWANGTGTCPHPNFKYNITFDSHLVPHVIGSKGSGLKTVMDRVGRTKGPGCFIVHKHSLNAFLIEGISEDQVKAGKSALTDHIERIKSEQGVVVVDLSQPTRNRGNRKAKATPQTSADTNSFSSLAETSDDDEEQDPVRAAAHASMQSHAIGKTANQLTDFIEPSKTEETRGAKTTSKPSSNVIHPDRLGFTQFYRTRNDILSHNREFQQAREAVAEKLGIEPRYVKDHQTNAFLRNTQVDAEDDVLDQARQSSAFEFDMSTSSSEGAIALTVDTPWSSAPTTVTAATGEVYTAKSTSVQAKEATAAAKKLAKSSKGPLVVDLAPAVPALSRQKTIETPADSGLSFPDLSFPDLKRPDLSRTQTIGVNPRFTTSSWGSDDEDEDEDGFWNDLPPLIPESNPDMNALGSNPGNDAYLAAQLEDLEEAVSGHMTMAELEEGAAAFNQDKTVHWDDNC